MCLIHEIRPQRHDWHLFTQKSDKNSDKIPTKNSDKNTFMFHVRIMCVLCIYHSGIIAVSFPYLKVHITDMLPFIRTYLSSIITWYHTAYKPYIITYLEISRDPYHAPYHRPYHKSVISRRDTGRPGRPHDTARESDTRKRNISYAYQTSISPTVYRAISLHIVFDIIRG